MLTLNILKLGEATYDFFRFLKNLNRTVVLHNKILCFISSLAQLYSLTLFLVYSDKQSKPKCLVWRWEDVLMETVGESTSRNVVDFWERRIFEHQNSFRWKMSHHQVQDNKSNGVWNSRWRSAGAMHSKLCNGFACYQICFPYCNWKKVLNCFIAIVDQMQLGR